MRILLANAILSRFQQELSSDGTDGHDWTIVDERDDEQLGRELPYADVLVGARLPAGLVASASNLKMVHVPGAGYDGIALDHLHPDVIVASTFHHGRSIAEHVIAVAIALCRGLLASDASMRAGQWHSVDTDPTMPFGRTLGSQTLGIIGLGEIGTQVARLAQTFGSQVQAVRRNPGAPTAEEVQLTWAGGMHELPRLLATSDIVVVTVPLTKATTGLIDANGLATMKETSFLINVSRGAVVEEDALYEALTSGSIAGAGLDVWWSTPTTAGDRPSRHAFESLQNVVLTPHQSGQTEDTFINRARDIAANIAALEAGRPLSHVVRAKPSTTGKQPAMTGKESVEPT